MFDSIRDLSDKLTATGYFIDPVMVQVVYLASKLQKPLLLEGPAGSGKTQLAISVASAAGTHVERLQCYRGVTEDKAIGRFDEGLQRLYMEFSKGQHENWQSVQANLKGRDFFRPGPLMRALECDRPCVLLIDELDKVDEGFEAMLLEILSAWTLSIPEFGTVAAKSIPFVVLTSNEERRLGDPIRRRSLYVRVEHPTPEREAEIIASRTPKADETFHREMAGIALSFRNYSLEKPPSVSEMIDFANALQLLGTDHVPTVTATAKPAASPIAYDIKGDSGEDFTPLIKVKSQWKPLIAPLFRDRLEKEGVEILDASELLIPAGTNAGGWTECGAIDSMGHSLQGDLVHQIETELKRIEDRVSSLLNSGWRRVHIVTDHGWLLLPGGLPRIDLPGYLVETKWARCAVVKGQPDLPVPVSIWYWNPAIRIASPPGIGSFRANETYAHGGISLQECVVPDLLVERGAATISAKITSIEWRRMRCRIRVETNNPSVRVDLRKNWKEQATSIVAARKALDANGEVSLVLDDTHEGAAASVVVVDVDGNVIAHQTTCVGEKA